MTDERRKSIRGFLQAAVTGEPRSADYEEAGLGGSIEQAARRWVGLVRKAASPAPGSRRAAELVEAGADALTAALPDDWEPPAEDPIALANQIPRG